MNGAARKLGRMSASKRRLELVEGSSSKFWEVSLDGASFTVTYGRIGAPGVSKTTQAGSAAEAAADVEKLVREKLKKGYQELGAPEQNYRPPAHIGTSAHVERFLNYKVVGFNPQASGDGEDGGRRELPALRELDKLVYAVGIAYDDEDAEFMARLEALGRDPKLGELRALVIGGWFSECCDGAPTDLYAWLIAHGPRLASLKGLFIGDVIQEESEISWLCQADLAPVLAALPTLEECVVRGGAGLRFVGLRHDNLRGLTVQTGGLSALAVGDIVSADLPELRRLTLWLGQDYYGGDSSVDDLAPLLRGDRFPKLEHLGLQDSPHADAIALAVSRSPLLPRLKSLDLSMGTLGDEGAAALLASPHLRSLKHLNLRHHYMSAAKAAELRGLGIEVNVSERQEAGVEDDRYIEVAE